ncbi:MAG TPA: ABC transporter permease [Gemmatimonadaceae bacterium]|jgi:putative ABC transport system permease protein|nr:ABC transporter permease [Gemmatimonadaceae bacterium]
MRRVFRLPGTKRRVDRELDDELRFHIEGRIEELMEREGLSRGDAEREAARRFGDISEYRRQTRAIDDKILQRDRRMDIIETVARESRHAVRTLRRSPGFSLIAILTLGIGLGAATTIFTVLDRVVLRPLPYPNADRLIHIGTAWPKVKADEEYGISRGQYFYFKQQSRALSDMLFYDGSVMIVPGDGDHPAERVEELDVSASTFRILGIRPQIGRLFTEQDELNPDGDPRVALLSDGYWRRRFGADPRILGKRIPYGDHTVEIVGVLPANMSVPDGKADIWIRNHLDPAAKPQNNHTHRGIGVLKPGVTVAAAAADLRRLQRQMQADYPNVYSQGFLDRTGFAMVVRSLRDEVVGSTIVRALWLIFGAVGLVLLIAAANVANLFLVRIDARRREAAVRAALGAGRSHLAAHYLTESALVGLAAATVACGVAFALLHFLLAAAPQTLPRLDEVSLDWRGLTFCVTAAMLFGLVFGLLPLGANRLDVRLLREGGRGLAGSRARDLARRGLVLSQVTLAVVLLSSAALMTKSFSRLRSVRPGFDPVGVTAMSISVPRGRYQNGAQVGAFWRELTQRVEAIPGIVHAGASGTLPLADEGGCSGIITDVVETGKERGNCMPMTMLTPGYLEAMGMKVKGTVPTWSELESGSGPTVVTASFARRFWGNENVIGRRVKMFNDQVPFFTIVGVVDDVHGRGLQEPPIQEVFFPMIGPPGSEQFWSPYRFMHFVVRAPSLSSGAVVTRVRQVLEQLDPQVPIADVLPMETVVAQSMAQTSFTMTLLLFAAAIALLLSGVGIYGVISYIVGQRRAEIGIRIALGARTAQVSRMIVGQSVWLAVVGAVVGVIAALAVTRFLRSLLFEVSPTDPLVLGGTCVVLVALAVVASLAPTRRAARVDPVEAMRY